MPGLAHSIPAALPFCPSSNKPSRLPHQAFCPCCSLCPKCSLRYSHGPSSDETSLTTSSKIEAIPVTLASLFFNALITCHYIIYLFIFFHLCLQNINSLKVDVFIVFYYIPSTSYNIIVTQKLCVELLEKKECDVT